MPRALSFVLFFTVALSIMGAIHGYVWFRLIQAPEWPVGTYRALTLAIIVLYVLVPFSFYLSRATNSPFKTLVTVPAYVWMGVIFILFTLVAGVDLVRLLGTAVQMLLADVPPRDPERRVAMARVIASATAVVGAGATLAALRSGLGRVAIKRVRVRLARLPQALDGTVIVQLSDVHVGPTIKKAFVVDLVRRVNGLEPDLIAITGDLVDGSVTELGPHVAPLSELRSTFGTFFVTGNHEYYSGPDDWCRELERLGIRVLRNERVVIGDAAASFDLAGIDDPEARRFGGGSDLARAVAGRDPGRELVLLAHQPRAVFQAQEHGVGLQLSGHTHGGQIWPWRYFVYLQQPVVAGLKRLGQTLLYVSSGTGYWGPPMRLGAPAEITHIVLESGAASPA
jgi:predicted MPP superfamily phosphohydrolase